MTVTTTPSEAIATRILTGGPDVFVHELTPSEADLLLELNSNNRSARTRISDQYAEDMRSGRWLYAAEPLKFDVDGILLDGQHRLLALASLAEELPDFSIKFMIVTGLDRQSQTVMDQGAKRTAGDNLSMDGIRNANEVAAAARTYILWSTGRMFTDQRSATARVGNTEAQEWVLSNPDFVEDCGYSLKFRKDIDVSARLYMAAYTTFRKIDAEAAQEFFSMWATGANLSVGHPVLTLRDKLGRIRRDKTKLSDRDALAMVVTSWNAFRSGRTLLRYSRPNGGLWTKATFPEAI